MTDRRIVLVVTIALAFLATASLAGIVVLAVLENPVPDVLQNIAVGGMSALAALLASTKSEGTAQPVQVVNEAADAVPVAETPAKAAKR